MKRLRKIASILLVLVMGFSFAACNEHGESATFEGDGNIIDGSTSNGGIGEDNADEDGDTYPSADDTDKDGEENVKPPEPQKPALTQAQIFAADAIPESGKLFRDPDFSSGFTVTSFASNDNPHYLGEVHYTQTSEQFRTAGGVGAQWILAQWGVRNRVLPDSLAKTEGGDYVYETESSYVRINAETGSAELGVDASKEYTAPRISGEAWPHLLFGQSDIFTREKYNDAPYLSEMKSLTVSVDFTVKKATNLMGDDYNPSLHAAQFQWFVVVQNMNRKSAGYGDMIWFGLPFYDNRDSGLTQDKISLDGGKGDASWKLICSMGTQRYLYEPVTVGKQTSVNADILGWIKSAFEKAKTEGDGRGHYAFENSEFSDLKITSTNIGWELPGTFDAAVRIEKFSADYTLK